MAGALESMTGFGGASGRIGGFHFTVAVRGVNHRSLDLHLRLPAPLRVFTEEITRRVHSRVERGRVELDVLCPRPFDQVSIDDGILGAYLKAARAIDPRADVRPADLLPGVLSLPGVSRVSESLPPRFSRSAFLVLIQNALLDFQKSRAREGRALSGQVRSRLRRIRKHCAVSRRALQKRRAQDISRLRQELLPLLDLPAAAEARILGLLRDGWPQINASEEFDRLELHLAAVEEQLTVGGAVGTKIEFFAQEMLREANTIAAKVADFRVRAMMVEVKTEVESIREQVRNLC